MSFRQGQRVTAWVDSKEEGRGEVLANFILGEHDFLGLEASALRSKICGFPGGKRFYKSRIALADFIERTCNGK